MMMMAAMVVSSPNGTGRIVWEVRGREVLGIGELLYSVVVMWKVLDVSVEVE